MNERNRERRWGWGIVRIDGQLRRAADVRIDEPVTVEGADVEPTSGDDAAVAAMADESG